MTQRSTASSSAAPESALPRLRGACSPPPSRSSSADELRLPQGSGVAGGVEATGATDSGGSAHSRPLLRRLRLRCMFSVVAAISILRAESSRKLPLESRCSSLEPRRAAAPRSASMPPRLWSSSTRRRASCISPRCTASRTVALRIAAAAAG
jgi:hypothetical protein